MERCNSRNRFRCFAAVRLPSIKGWTNQSETYYSNTDIDYLRVVRLGHVLGMRICAGANTKSVNGKEILYFSMDKGT